MILFEQSSGYRTANYRDRSSDQTRVDIAGRLASVTFKTADGLKSGSFAGRCLL